MMPSRGLARTSIASQSRVGATVGPVTRSVFDGDISGLGTSTGTRIVVGHWTSSPLGDFTDVMVEFADGERLLLAPSDAVREFVTATYRFDTTTITGVSYHRRGDSVSVSAGDLEVSFRIGGPTLLGRLLSVAPTAVVTSPWFCTISDPIARVALRGVRTKGTAGGGRREYYGAHGQHHITATTASWKGDDLGPLSDVDPPVRFGFGSTPRTPSTTLIRTTIDER